MCPGDRLPCRQRTGRCATDCCSCSLTARMAPSGRQRMGWGTRGRWRTLRWTSGAGSTLSWSLKGDVINPENYCGWMTKAIKMFAATGLYLCLYLYLYLYQRLYLYLSFHDLFTKPCSGWRGTRTGVEVVAALVCTTGHCVGGGGQTIYIQSINLLYHRSFLCQ